MLKDLNIPIPNINDRDRVPMKAIQAVVDHIAQIFNPEKIILFGSYAYGDPGPGSDVDLLVVIDTEAPKQMQMDIALSFLHPFGLDILVRTPQEIRERLSLGDFFLREIVSKGKIVYEGVKTLPWESFAEVKEMGTGSNSHTLEWVQKAEGDFIAATKLLDLDIATLADTICFHRQQCVEKYLKAYLHQKRIEFSRTHDLMVLLSLCEQKDNTFAKISPELQALNSYSIETRYPGRFTTIEEAKDAVKTMKTLRTFIRSKLES